MANIKPGSLNRDTYLDWIDLIQGHATDCGVWKFIDPKSRVQHVEPEKPRISDYKADAVQYSNLNNDEKEMLREDKAQYRVDIQNFKQECRLIGEIRSKIVESLGESHRKLIFGHMTCREVLKQIKDRLEPAQDLQRLKLIDDYSKARITPNGQKIDSWLMEWERLDILIKRLKIVDFSDYKLTQDFLSAANPLLPMWATNKRMEILKLSDKTELKYIDVLQEFRQFWVLTEFEADYRAVTLTSSLQGMSQNPSSESKYNSQVDNNASFNTSQNGNRNCRCGNTHASRECYYLAEGRAPKSFVMDENIMTNFKEACNRPKFRAFIRKADLTSNWLKNYVNEKWPSNGQKEIENNNKRGTFTTSVGFTAFSSRLSHPLRNEILLDSGANGHVCNNLSLATSPIITPETPSFVQSGAGSSPIIGYGNITFNANRENGENYEMTITNVAFSPEYLTSVISWKLLKRKGIKWDTETNKLTYKDDLICKLLKSPKCRKIIHGQIGR